MKITICNTEKEFFQQAAWRIAMTIVTCPDALIGLSTGRTTGGIHNALVKLYADHPFDTSHITVFGVDEITNISPDYFGCCYYMLLHEVVKPLGIPLENYVMPPTYSSDFKKECLHFEETLKLRGPVRLQVLGIVENGHLGFNQPGTPFGSTTWVSKMDKELDERIHRETNSPPDKVLGGLTLGIKNIMQSEKILLVANGARKARIIREALYGPITEAIPASILQLHPNCEVLVDDSAGSSI